MSPTNTTDENWLLLQTRYDYMALPMDIAVLVLKHMKMVTLSDKQLALCEADLTIKLVNGEAITVAMVRAKMLPEK